MSSPLLGYIDRDGPLHTLSGVSKLVLSLGVVLGAMIGFDVRYLAAVSAGSILLWAVSRVRLRDLAVVLWLIAIFMVLNNIGIFLFAPGYGTDLFGTRHLLLEGPWRWDVTAEQLFYQLAVTLKYVAVLPAVLLFVATTRPPEFASSLARVGVPYRIAYAVSLALRYIPDVQREFLHDLPGAAGARDRSTSRAVRLPTRLRNLTSVLMPLLLGTFDRIESVSAAMELRGFGRAKGRTWSCSDTRPCRDVFVIVVSIALCGDADRSAGGQRRTVLEPVPLSGRRCRSDARRPPTASCPAWCTAPSPPRPARLAHAPVPACEGPRRSGEDRGPQRSRGAACVESTSTCWSATARASNGQRPSAPL